MARSIKVAELKTREILKMTEVHVLAGANGYVEYSFEIEKIKPKHRLAFEIDVSQPLGRTDLDIGLSVMDDDNYHKWLRDQPSTAYIVASRFKFGTLTFYPPKIGLYHAVLDNRYSVFTSKDVFFNIYETWLEEKAIRIPTYKAKEKVETKPKIGLWQRFLAKLKSRSISVIVLLIMVQLICVALAIGIANLLHFTLGIEYKDTISYIATAVGGSAVVLLVYLYFTLTGRPLIPLPTPSKQ